MIPMKTRGRVGGVRLMAGGLLAGSLLAAAGASAAEVTFFSWSDMHYEVEDTAGRAMVGVINTLPGTAWPAAMGGVVGTPRGVVMQGDLIDDGARNDLYPAQWDNWLADFGVNGEGRCQFPVFEGIGNHDLNGNLFMFGKVAERNVIRKNLGLIDTVSPNGYHYSWDWDGVHFVNVNLFAGNVWPGESDGYGPVHDPMGARDFLVQDLQDKVGNSGRPVVVIQHYRPVDENWWTYSAADRFHKVLQDYNVIMIMVGHQGGGINNTWRGINWASSNGVLEVYRISADNKLSIAVRSASAWGNVFQKSIFLSYAASGLAAALSNGEWATNVSTTGATLSGKLLYEAVSPTEVTLYWGTTDGGTNPGGWQHSRKLGVRTPGTVFSTEIDGLEPWQNYFYRCRATNSQGSAWAAASIPFTTDGALPAGWGTGFIGYEQRPWGGANESAGTFTVRGSGRDIGEGGQTIDNFQYAWRSLDGDGEIKARVATMAVNSRDPKAGVMMRETPGDNSRNVSVLLSPNEGIRFLARSNTGGGTTASANNAIDAPYWVRLVRSANTFTGSMSADGRSWTQVGSPVSIAMASNISVGLAVTAGNRDGSQNHTATFDNVTVTGQSSPSAPTISHIPDQELNGNGSTGPLAFTVGDLETDPSLLTVSGATSNPTLVPEANILLGGSGADRSVTVTPAPGQAGTATVTLTVSDGALTGEESFLVAVTAGQLLVSQWRSVGEHDGAPHGLPIADESFVEPRAAGIREVEILFAEAIVVPDPAAAVAITGLDSSGAVSPLSLGITVEAAIGPSGNTLLVTFADGGSPCALPDAVRWRFTLDPAAITGLGGSVLSASPATTRVITGLVGDFDGDGRVTGTDLNRIANVAAFNPSADESLRADVDGDASVGTADLSAAWANRGRRTDLLATP